MPQPQPHPTSLKPKYRNQFKQKITKSFFSTNYNNLLTSQPQQFPIQSSPSSLKQISIKTFKQQINKNIHILSKQSFITKKKQFLLNRRINYKSQINQHNQQINSKKACDMFNHSFRNTNKHKNPTNTKLFNKLSTQSTQKIQQSASSFLFQQNQNQQKQIFPLSSSIMQNPFFYHRKMITKIHDNQPIRKILNQWYKNNVQTNLQQLKKDQINKIMEKQFSLINYNNKSKFKGSFIKKQYQTDYLKTISTKAKNNKVNVKMAMSLCETEKVKNQILCKKIGQQKIQKQTNIIKKDLRKHQISKEFTYLTTTSTNLLKQQQNSNIFLNRTKTEQSQQQNLLKYIDKQKKQQEKLKFSRKLYQKSKQKQKDNDNDNDNDKEIQQHKQNAQKNKKIQHKHKNIEDNETNRLLKIMVRVQPYWYKVRIKI